MTPELRWSIKNLVSALIGFSIALASNGLLFYGWSSWKQSAWADCPTYAFGAMWYPEPPMPVTLLPWAVSVFGIALFTGRLLASRRMKQGGQSVVNAAGLSLNCLPLVATFIIPVVSGLLHRDVSGC